MTLSPPKQTAALRIGLDFRPIGMTVAVAIRMAIAVAVRMAVAVAIAVASLPTATGAVAAGLARQGSRRSAVWAGGALI